MRFSSIFRHRVPLQQGRPEDKPAREDPHPSLPGPELPDELDARVRLLGEWQVSEL